MKSTVAGLAVALGSLVVCLPAEAGIVVSFNPTLTTVGAGVFFDVDAVVTNLGVGVGKDVVSGFDLNVFFNSTFIKGLGADENLTMFGGAGDRFFGPATGMGSNNLGLSGLSILAESALQGLQGDSFVLATFHFQALLDGATTLQFGTSIPFESNLVGGNVDASGNALTLTAAFGTACVVVGNGSSCQVPEPSGYGLLGLALLGLLAPAIRRRCGSDAATAA